MVGYEYIIMIIKSINRIYDPYKLLLVLFLLRLLNVHVRFANKKLTQVVGHY